MAEEKIHKIIYFDKETIRNILQERNKGEKTHILDSSTSFQRESSIETAGEVELSTPFLARLKFLFSSKMDVKYIVKKDETTTISSTEISEFEELKSSLKGFKSVKLQDIENSATFYRTAGGYLRIVKGGVDGVDIKEFNNVMDYSIQKEPEKFKDNILRISDAIVGQDRAIIEISKSLWYLISVQRKKPYVIMLYGNSSLGKTELVREIAKHFFEGKVLEKHLSMFKNNNYSDYFFGEEPNRRSLGFDLLERTSNLIFLDELDKCPEFFYSAFYTLFDNVEFKDATYCLVITLSSISAMSSQLPCLGV